MTGHKKYIQFSGNMVQSPLKIFLSFWLQWFEKQSSRGHSSHEGALENVYFFPVPYTWECTCTTISNNDIQLAFLQKDPL